MSFPVEERGRRIATFRFVETRLMETAAAWTPTTPEMEVKVVLGRHVWDFAQHADALGRRTFELRLPLQHSLPPVEPYRALLAEVAALEGTGPRLAALYDVVLPGLERRYARYLQATDAVLDGPSVVIIERILLDLPRQRREAEAVRRELGLAAADPVRLAEREAAVEEMAGAAADG
jgi:hypothetical protein